MTNITHYKAYLVRFERNHAQHPWRVRLENINTGEVYRFGSEQALLLYLSETFSQQSALHKSIEAD